MHIAATQARFNQRIAFDHDPLSRTVTGTGAALVRSMVATWDGKGILYGTQPVSAQNPLGSFRDMAVMLACWGWELPPELVVLLPPAERITDGAEA